MALLGAAAGCGEPAPEAPGQVQGAIRQGTPGGEDAVVALVARRLACGDDGARAALCTGTLVAPRFVLTSAHCLERRLPGELQVAFGATTQGATRDVIAARMHPGYDPATGALDVALLELAAPAEVAPLPLAEGIPGGLAGGQVRVVGFGLDEQGATGVRRQGTARVSALEGPLLRYAPEPSMTCSGDSGGPVLFLQDGVARIVAVTRSGDEACTGFGTALLVDAFRSDFLDPLLAAAPSTPPVLDPAADFCAAPCDDDGACPPSMLCLTQRDLGKRCGFPSLQSGRFGAPCPPTGDCGAGVCLAVPGAPQGDCRCFSPCDAEQLSSRQEALQGGGCQVNEHPLNGLTTLALAALAAVLARRRRGP